MKVYWISYFSQRDGRQDGCTILAKDDDEFAEIWERDYVRCGYEIADWGSYEYNGEYDMEEELV